MTDEIETTPQDSETSPQVSDEPADVSSNDTPEPVVSEDDAAGAIYDRLVTNNGADRDESGKFKSPKAEAEATEKSDAAPGGEGEGAEDEPAALASDAPTAPSAPSHLPESIKAAWEKLPAEAKTAMAEFTAGQDRKFAEIGRELSRYKPVSDVVNEFREYFDGTKGQHDPAQAMRSLFNIQRNMDRDPVGTLWQIANTYGIANQLFQGNADASREISALTQQISQLQSHIAKISDGEYLQNQFSLFNQQEGVNKAIEDFAASAPFYDQVENMLPSFIDVARSRLGDTAAPGEVLKAAYDMAVNAIPEVRTQVEATKQVDVANQHDSKRSEAARKANSINVKSKGGGSQSFSSDEEAMAAIWDKHNAA